MSDCCSGKGCQLDVLRRRQASTLKIVLLINAAMFFAEFAAGWAAGSVALVSDSLDMLGDALVYGFSLYAVTESLRTKALAARIKGLIMAAFALAAFGQVVYRLLVPQVPAFEAMGAMGLLALLANGVCFALLWRHRTDDINMSSVWLCSRNDLIANVNPTFSWVRLAQRIPVRIAIDDVPKGITLSAGMTATVVVTDPNDPNRIKPPVR